MKRRIESFEEYVHYWNQAADSTHQHWWGDYINSGHRSVERYLRERFKKYRARYGP